MLSMGVVEIGELAVRDNELDMKSCHRGLPRGNAWKYLGNPVSQPWFPRLTSGPLVLEMSLF